MNPITLRDDDVMELERLERPARHEATCANVEVDDAIVRVIAKQVEKRLVLNRRIEALHRLRDRGAKPGPDVVLVLYLALGGAGKAADFCNSYGWRLPGAKGPRRYSPNDVSELIRAEGGDVDETLRTMAREKLDDPAKVARRNFTWG